VIFKINLFAAKCHFLIFDQNSPSVVKGSVIKPIENETYILLLVAKDCASILYKICMVVKYQESYCILYTYIVSNCRDFSKNFKRLSVCMLHYVCLS
jgi:hypothetical protein